MLDADPVPERAGSDSARRREPDVLVNISTWGRARPVQSAAWKEPSNPAIGVPLHRPPVLVDESMMERADQQEVVQVRSAAMPPPHDVVGLGKSSRPAPGEPALAVPVADLAEHPR
jgi:hypothetical protein